MEHSDHLKSRFKWLIPIIVFAIGTAVLYGLVYRMDMESRTKERFMAQLNAQSYAELVKSEIHNDLSLSDSLDTLTHFGYGYRLSRKDTSRSDDFEVVYSSGDDLSDPVIYDFRLGDTLWRFEVMPDGGWNNKTQSRKLFMYGFIVIILVAVLISMLIIMDEHVKLMKHLAKTDPLTGLLNRNGFDEEMKQYMSVHTKSPCVGILLDIDNFKFINDVYGHATGDKVLKQLSDSMQKHFKDNALIGRNGGDEFCIILKNSMASDAEDSIKQFTMQPKYFMHENKEHSYSISLGYAEYPEQCRSLTDLIRYADMALYEVKMQGKHGYIKYSSEFDIDKRKGLGFAFNDISENLPGAFLIYSADPANDRLIFANREMIRFAGCEDMDDFLKFTGKSFRNLIRPDEREAVENSIWRQINNNEFNSNDYVRYHFAVKGGGYRDVLDFGRIVDSPRYGRVFYVLLIDWEFVGKHYN